MSGPSLFTMAMMSLRGVVSSESEVENGPAATTAENPGDTNHTVYIVWVMREKTSTQH